MLTPFPSPSQAELESLDDAELERLALGWRAEAARGNRQAFGVAHALEAERRRRLRDSRLQSLDTAAPSVPARAWWKFW